MPVGARVEPSLPLSFSILPPCEPAGQGGRALALTITLNGNMTPNSCKTKRRKPLNCQLPVLLWLMPSSFPRNPYNTKVASTSLPTRLSGSRLSEDGLEKSQMIRLLRPNGGMTALGGNLHMALLLGRPPLLQPPPIPVLQPKCVACCSFTSRWPTGRLLRSPSCSLI